MNKTRDRASGLSGLMINFALIVISLACCLFLAEIAVRYLSPQMTGPVQFAFDTELGSIPAPSQQGRRSLPGVYTYCYTNDSRGMRIVPGAEEQLLEKRVLLLGDSFTYGIGVDDEQTFAADLQAEFPNVRILNGGSGGKGTDYALKFLSVRGPELRPDIVVLGFFPNDFCDNKREEYFSRSVDGALQVKPLIGSVGARKTFLAAVPGYNWIISHSHLANLVKRAAIQFLTRNPENQAGTGIVVGSVPPEGCADDTAQNLTKSYLSALKTETERQGGSLYCFYIPDMAELALPDSSLDESAFLRLSRELGLTAFSMRPYLKDSGYTQAELYLAEGHWSPLGHKIAGNVLGEFLGSRLSYEQPAPSRIFE